MAPIVSQTIAWMCFLAYIFISTVSSQEEKEWKQNGNYSYLFIRLPARRTWHQAQIECRKSKALLTSIIREKENNFLLSQIKSPSPERYWIGLTALNIWDDYGWLDENPLSYENWIASSNHKNSQQRDKCVTIESVSGKWEDSNCGEVAGAICKKRTDGTEKLLPLPTMPPTGNCPLEWRQYDNKCYKIIEEARNWTAAKEFCRSIGQNRDLASVHSIAENMFVTSILTNDSWIGGTSLKNENHQGWSDNSPVDYNRLRGGVTEWNGKCVQILADELRAGTWEAVSCSEERIFVCQRYIDPLFPIGPSIAPPKCYNDNYELVGYKNGCYLSIKNEKKTWVEAEKFCESLGAHLSSLENVFESSFVFSYLYPLPDDVWIGLRSTEGVFKWLQTWPLSYTNWMSGQPVNALNNTDQCVVLDVETQQWKVEKCDSEHAFLCKLSDEELPVIEEFTGVCPDHLKDGVDVGGRYCYKVYDDGTKTDWASAEEICVKHKTALASFHSADEMKQLGPHLKDVGDAWIGLGKSDDGIRRWTDGSPVDFVSWGEDVVPDEDCVAINASSLMWQGANCVQQKPFICGAPKVNGTVDAIDNKDDNGKKGLSSGAVVGIIIVVLIVVAALAGLVYYLWKNDKIRF